MVLIASLAVFGAAVGARVRPRAAAVVAALLLGGGMRLAVDVVLAVERAAPHPTQWMNDFAAWAADPGVDYLAAIATAGAAALFAGLLSLILGERGEIGRPKDRSGRWRRLKGMIEERPSQSAAEARLHSVYDGKPPI
jgi:hypothetical protein